LQGRGDIQAITVGEMQFPIELRRIIAGHFHAIEGDGSGISKKSKLFQVVRSELAIVPLRGHHQPKVIAEHIAEQCEYTGRRVVSQLIACGIQRQGHMPLAQL
jgi:hypothetical protein